MHFIGFAIAAVFLVLTIAAIIALVFIRRAVRATVEGFSWKRRVYLEHYAWVPGTSYMGFPDGSRNHQVTTERYQTYQVTGSQTRTIMVNGTPTQMSQPSYSWVSHKRKKYTYEVQQWTRSRELLAEGDDRESVHWPSYTLEASPMERVYRTEERYEVSFRTEKGQKIYRLQLPEKDWAGLDDQVSYQLSLTLFGAIRDFTPISVPVPSEAASQGNTPLPSE